MSELQGLQSELTVLERAGVTVIAVSNDDRPSSISSVIDHNLEFDVLRDSAMTAIDSYGVRHADVTFLGRGIARPAVFLIDEAGIVRWSFVTDNWRVRVRPEQVIAAVGALDNAPSPP